MKIKDILFKLLIPFIPFFGAFLGALGGSEDGNKMFRRIGIPLVLVASAFLKTESVFVLLICSMMGVLSIGYGIPDALDKGSALGRFWYNFYAKNTIPYEAYIYANLTVRGIIGFLICLSLLPLPIILHNWNIYILCSIGIILTNMFVSWGGFIGNWGSYVFLGKRLSWAETFTWGLITLFATLMIIL